MSKPLAAKDLRRMREEEMYLYSSWLLRPEGRSAAEGLAEVSRRLAIVEVAHARLDATMNIVGTEEVRLIAAKASEAESRMWGALNSLKDAVAASAHASDADSRKKLALIEELGLERRERLSWSAEAEQILAVEGMLTASRSELLKAVQTPAGTGFELVSTALEAARELREWDSKRGRLLAMRRPSVSASVSEARREWIEAVLGYVNAVRDSSDGERREALLGAFSSMLLPGVHL